MYFKTDYYNALDRGYYHADNVAEGKMSEMEASEKITDLTAIDIGTSEAGIDGATPLQHLQAAIKQGAAKMEFTFFGQGKSSGQQYSPEAIGKAEREQIRELSKLNEVKFTTHASVAINGASGLTKEGFHEEARAMALKEINKAIDFAGDASSGGAVVFHTGEWQRPLSDIKGQMFKEYKDEEKKSPIMVADRMTGEISAFRRDQSVFEPKFHTAETYEKELGKPIIGMRDNNGLLVEKNDWVDINGNAIKREWLLKPEKSGDLFNRVPVWNKDKTNFEVNERKYEDFEKEAKEMDIAPEVLFMKSQIANSVLQAKGQSLMYAKDYEHFREGRDAIKKALDMYSKIEENMPEAEKWKLLVQKGYVDSNLVPPANVMPTKYLTEKLKQHEDQMRHIHESSASADAQARQALEKMNRVTTVEDVGMSKSADTIAQAGMRAMDVSKRHKKDIKEAIYIAPESFMPQMYGSHPDEMRKIIEESRKKMKENLMARGYSESEAKDKAKTHIKGTLDTGHFNQWRQFFQAKEGESPEKAEKRFEKWFLDETEKLAKEGLIGHIHLTDNFGYDDEHLTPGQGNVPFKEFMKRMEKAGVKDFIVERGSFNPLAMHETLSAFGSPVYALGPKGNFSQFRHGHFGYNAPPNYIVGAYAPSNEWKLWSEVPLE